MPRGLHLAGLQLLTSAYFWQTHIFSVTLVAVSVAAFLIGGQEPLKGNYRSRRRQFSLLKASVPVQGGLHMDHSGGAGGVSHL